MPVEARTRVRFAATHGVRTAADVVRTSMTSPAAAPSTVRHRDVRMGTGPVRQKQPAAQRHAALHGELDIVSVHHPPPSDEDANACDFACHWLIRGDRGENRNDPSRVIELARARMDRWTVQVDSRQPTAGTGSLRHTIWGLHTLGTRGQAVLTSIPNWPLRLSRGGYERAVRRATLGAVRGSISVMIAVNDIGKQHHIAERR